MSESLGEQLIHFTRMHDRYIQDWNDAMASGDTSAVERMSEDYVVAFFHGVKDKPVLFSRAEAVSGMQQSVHELLGAKKVFNHRVIRLKDESHAVVFYELCIEKEDQVLARLFTIEKWELIEGRWMVAGEIEQGIQ